MNFEEHTFRLDSGSLALDFLNTGSRGDGREPGDALGTPAALLAFLEAAGLAASPGPMTPALRATPGARILWTEARRLRHDLAALFGALGTGTRVPPPLVYALNRILDAGPTSSRLEFAAGGPRLLRAQAGEGPLAVLAPIALDAVRLVTATAPYRIRSCDSVDCGRWFVDTSKGGRRRWCSMATCGNRAKATRHRRKAEADT